MRGSGTVLLQPQRAYEGSLELADVQLLKQLMACLQTQRIRGLRMRERRHRKRSDLQRPRFPRDPPPAVRKGKRSKGLFFSNVAKPLKRKVKRHLKAIAGLVERDN
ncbi:hypothetical protein NDU88_006027 [Pleurodeles waltl]|uniref:Uncharacterized protein n=1 Tax=Pleurodeles waltl TaxID=8319 RepID=A0AAV7PJX5_PLEWA|nr:hypothetical protein NDU88_006027 [Pleurodeles waltl]